MYVFSIFVISRESIKIFKPRVGIRSLKNRVYELLCRLEQFCPFGPHYCYFEVLFAKTGEQIGREFHCKHKQKIINLS